MRILFLIIAAGLLEACAVGAIASTAVSVVTLPVKVVSKGVDLATTSQSEADENRGRALRKEEEEAGKRARIAAEQCRKSAARGEPCPPPPELLPN